jgi:RNA polymerase sigma-54 factor
MEILQLPILALEQRIQQELQENPVLEVKEGMSNEQTDGENKEADFDPLEAFDSGEHRYHEEHRPSRNRREEEADKKHDALQSTPARPESLHDYLSAQLPFLDSTPEQLRLLRFLITHLNDKGYLSVSTEEIVTRYDPPVRVAEVEEVLRLLQQLDPPGVGARSAQECLLLQVTAETPHREVVRVLITDHLEDLAHHRLPQIQRRTGWDRTTIQEALAILKQLTLRPGAPFKAENIPYVVPDLAVEVREKGAYQVRLLDDWTPSLYLSRRYLELYRDPSADPKAKEYLQRKIQAARWLLQAIAQRRRTLEKVTQAVIQHQRGFLEQGPAGIAPLTMQQIAEQVGVHVTTVSRAVDDKWVQTPRGLFPLRRFFGGGTQTASGAAVAWETIQQKLRVIIDNEDKSNPLADDDLVKHLHAAGYAVARRTVTKYRKLLRIPSSRPRKAWTTG